MLKQMTYRQAINLAMHQEMQRDESVFTYGIDVDDHKRIFGSTAGLLEEFGPERCFSTPLSEDAMTGVGLGAAINGLRPVHVHMRVDFLTLAMNQLSNMVSSYCYGSGGIKPVPLTIRAIIGRGWGQAYQHSKSMHSIFAHLPGLKVVMPASAYEAKGLLTAAIRDNNPVIVMEHRWLYDAIGEVEEDSYTLPLAGMRKLRDGKYATVVATSWMNVEALKAAEILSRYGIELEIFNAYSISSCDCPLLYESVRRTGICYIMDNDWSYCGFSAELADQINRNCWGALQMPVVRFGFAHTPCPCTRPLENEFYPNAIDLIKHIEEAFPIPKVDLSQEEFYSYENKFKGPF